MLLLTGFENGAGGVEVTSQEGGGGTMTYELPSSMAARSGANGLRVSVTVAFDPPWKAKVSLGSFWAVSGMQQLVVTYWAKVEAPAVPGGPLPLPHVDVLDLDEDFEWLGFWQPCTIAPDHWTLCQAAVSLGTNRRGHALDVSIVIGHIAGTTLFDDILVVQQLAPPPAPPLPPPPVPPFSRMVLAEDFEMMRKQTWPPDAAYHGPFTDPRAVRADVLPSLATTPKDDVTNGHMLADVPTKVAAHSGTGGALLLVKQAFTPPWRARLQLGTHIVLLGDVRVSFWGRASEGRSGQKTVLPVSVDVIDVSADSEWVGVAVKVHLGPEWQRHEARLLVGPERRAHQFSFALIVGAAAGEYLIDDVRIEQQELPMSLSSGTLRLSFEAEDTADALAGGLAVVDLGGGTISSNLQHMHAARTGLSCARIEVSRKFDPAWHAKLTLGSFRAVDSQLTVTLHARLERASLVDSVAPFVTVDVLDSSSEAVHWLGYWRRFNLSAVEWRGFEAVVPLLPGKRGHVLEVSLVVGYATGTYLIDDVSVTQGPAPPSPPSQPPVMGGTTIDFEDEAAAAAAVQLQLHGGGGRAQMDSSSPLGGRDGGNGAVVRVYVASEPAWGARLNLGWFEAERDLMVIKLAGGWTMGGALGRWEPSGV